MHFLSKRKLQTKLTLSHLTVTLLAVLLLAALILTGYFVYLKTSLPAAWVGEEAFGIAEEIGYRVDVEGEAFDGAFTCSFVEEITDEPCAKGAPTDQAGRPEFVFDPNNDVWFILVDPKGRILDSNYKARFVPGAQLQNQPPPGFRLSWLDLDPAQVTFDNREHWTHFAIEGNHFAGQAVIVTGDDQVLGWVYYRENDRGFSTAINQMAVYLGGGLLVAALAATLVSGVMGSFLARSFSRRLRDLNQASVRFASGRLQQRVETAGRDEIAQLGRQFNVMADQIDKQMRELRQLADKNARLAEEAGALAQLEERNRLARELHDAIKQQLFGLSLTAGSVQPLMEKDPPLAAKRLKQLSQMTHEILEEMDLIIRQLRPASLADRGLAVALEALTRQWRAQTGIEVNFNVTGQRELPIAIEQSLYRIAQEALNNVARHAHAKRVDVALTYDLKRVRLQVLDDGCGFEPAASRTSYSLGLASMRARVAETGGRLHIDSQPQRGTTITASVPSGALEVPHA